MVDSLEEFFGDRNFNVFVQDVFDSSVDVGGTGSGVLDVPLNRAVSRSDRHSS